MLKIKSFQKKILKISIMTFLVMISSILFTNSVSALETTSGSFPDIPDGFDKFIIARSSSDTADVLYTWNSSATVYVHNFSNNTFYFSNSMSNINSLNTTSVSIYVLESDEWVYREKTGNSVWGYSTIYATNVYIKGYNLIDTSYGAGYGLSEKPSSNIYDMSSWIDIGEFTLLNENMTPEDYYIIIWEESETAGYRLVCWKKNGDASIYASVLDQGGVFPYTPTITFFYADDELKNVSYYDETEPFSKIINSVRTNTGSTFEASKIVYSNVDIWNLYDNGTEAYKWFDLSKVNYEFTSFNEFNEVIDTNEVRSIQLDFIIPSNSLGTSLDFSYNINSNKNLFDSPYFTSSEIYCSTDETGAYFCTPFAKSIDWYLDYNFATTQNDILKNYNSTIEKYSHYEVNNYSYTLFNDSKSVESISMFISFDTVSGFDVNINFESNLKFNIIYNYKNTSDVVDSPFLEDYYSTIDLTGKYGVAFLPQTNLDDSLAGYRTLFKADNLTDIQLRDNYDGKEYLILSAYSLNYCNEFLSNQNKIPYSCNNINGIFDFYINQGMDKQTLFFINKNYDNNSELNITYDTRYYSYIIFETENSTGSVIRPGEEEETEIYIGYFYNYYDKYKNYELEHNFDIFLKPIKFIFDSISDFYNYYCPPVFKSFLMISFTFVVSLILIKLFL